MFGFDFSNNHLFSILLPGKIVTIFIVSQVDIYQIEIWKFTIYPALVWSPCDIMYMTYKWYMQNSSFSLKIYFYNLSNIDDKFNKECWSPMKSSLSLEVDFKKSEMIGTSK